MKMFNLFKRKEKQKQEPKVRVDTVFEFKTVYSHIEPVEWHNDNATVWARCLQDESVKKVFAQAKLLMLTRYQSPMGFERAEGMKEVLNLILSLGIIDEPKELSSTQPWEVDAGR